MTDYKNNPAGDKLALTINFTRAFADGQGVQFATTVPQDVSLDDLNALMDKMRHAGRRQALWAATEAIEGEIDHNVRQESQLLASIETVDRKYTDMARIPTADKAARDQALAAVVRVQVESTKLHGRLDTLRKELNGG